MARRREGWLCGELGLGFGGVNGNGVRLGAFLVGCERICWGFFRVGNWTLTLKPSSWVFAFYHDRRRFFSSSSPVSASLPPPFSLLIFFFLSSSRSYHPCLHWVLFMRLPMCRLLLFFPHWYFVGLFCNFVGYGMLLYLITAVNVRSKRFTFWLLVYVNKY